MSTKTLDNNADFLKQFLINHFDLVKDTKNRGLTHLCFEARNSSPKKEASYELIAMDFRKKSLSKTYPYEVKRFALMFSKPPR